ncbi:MAG: hypothetical protein SFU98_01320 [Leptospiraceae bacterium]|nr:hypothetical protein [Leptospiraceae bacterium]
MKIQFTYLIKIFFVIFLFNCKYPSIKENSLNKIDFTFDSEDKTLKEIFSKSYSSEDGSKHSIQINLTVKKEGLDYLSNLSLSLATLTTGYFSTNSAEVELEFQYNLNSKEKKLLVPLNVQIGSYGFMPIYMGLTATLGAIPLNYTRNPTHLKLYCETKPSILREKLEYSQEEFCEEYKGFLEAMLFQNQSKIYETLNQIKLEASNANKN